MANQYYIYDVWKKCFLRKKENQQKTKVSEEEKEWTQSLLDLGDNERLLFIPIDEIDDNKPVEEEGIQHIKSYYGGSNPND